MSDSRRHLALKVGISLIAILSAFVAIRFWLKVAERSHDFNRASVWNKKIAALPQNAEACRTANGRWTDEGNSDRFFCLVRTHDTGRRCLSLEDCEGVCIVSPDATQTPEHLKCSDSIPQKGCSMRLDGSTIAKECRD